MYLKNLRVYILTLVRIALGVFWILQLTWKFPPEFGCPNTGFCLWLNKEINYPLVPLYAQTVLQLVKSHVYFFGWFTDVLEVSIGVFLVSGIYTRLAAGIGSLWSLNLLIGLASVPGENAWFYVFLILLNLVYVGLNGSDQLNIKNLLKH